MMRKKTRPRFLTMSFSLVALLVLILSACGGSSGPSSSGSGASGTPVRGGTWIDDLYEEPDSLLPNMSSETFATMVMEIVNPGAAPDGGPGRDRKSTRLNSSHT